MTRLSLRLTGMECTGCEHRISVLLRRLEGVGRVAASHRAGTVVVDYDPAAVDEDTIKRRLAAAGYDSVQEHPTGPEPSREQT